MIMSIIGPRETHDYRNYNLLGSGTIKSKKKKEEGVLRTARHGRPRTDGQGTIGEDQGCNRSALPSGFRQRLLSGFPSVAFPQKHDDRAAQKL